MRFAGTGKSNFDMMHKRCFAQTMLLKMEVVSFIITNATRKINSIIYAYGSPLSVNIPVSTEMKSLIQVGGSKNIVRNSLLNT